MHDEDVVTGSLLEDPCLTLDELAGAAAVSREWLLARIEEGLIAVSGPSPAEWQFSAAALRRVRRMHEIERDFDAVPELAALVADLLEEVDALRSRLESSGL
jgi:chaperone modulatory protein CbpM